MEDMFHVQPFKSLNKISPFIIITNTLVIWLIVNNVNFNSTIIFGHVRDINIVMLATLSYA